MSCRQKQAKRIASDGDDCANDVSAIESTAQPSLVVTTLDAHIDKRTLQRNERIKVNMNLEQLRVKLNEIKQMGYVISKRKGDTGVGYTLETLLGLGENNLQIPDIGQIEIKSQRKDVSNRVTMFTFNRGVWKIEKKELIQRYGYVDKNDRPSLYCSINSKPNNQGLCLRLSIDSVLLYHVDGTFVAEWTAENLIDRFMSKMPLLVLVRAKTRLNSRQEEEFCFDEAYLLTNPHKDCFLDLIRKDIIIVDVRMHLKTSGTVRNHGTAFRIDEKFLNLCFGNMERLI